MMLRIPLNTVLAALGLSFVASVANAQAPAGQEAQDQMSLQQKAQQVEQQLIEIQQKTLEENPDLRDQGEALEALITETMKEQGASPEEDMSRLKELQQQAQNPNVSQAERQEMAVEFQQIQRDLIRARQRASQDEKVQSQQVEFQTAMLEAMQEQNPKTEQLLAEMQEIQLERQRQLQEQLQQQGQEPAPDQQPLQQ